MQMRRWVPAFGLLLASLAIAAPAGADSAFEREFAQLKEQREAARAAALEPIERRYQAALEQLLRRATQGSDLDTAVKVKEELDNFPSSSDPRNTPLELIGLWALGHPGETARLPREIKPNGKFISETPPGGKWTINGNKLILTYNDPKFVDTYELPIRNHQLTGVNKQKQTVILYKDVKK